MRLKRKRKTKDTQIGFRADIDEVNELQLKANLYCEGNLSEYLIYAGLNFIPDKNDFEENKNKNKKGKK